MQHLHRTPTMGPFEARLPARNMRSPQLRDAVGREASFNRRFPKSSQGQGLPSWIKKQGFKGAVVAAFLGGMILCCVVLMGIVVKPEDPVRVRPTVEKEVKVVKATPVPTSVNKELETVKTRLAEEIKKNAVKEKEREIDKAETDRLRDLIKQEHFKEGRQQQELAQRLDELEKAHARLQEKHRQEEVERKRRIFPYTISPAYKLAHKPQEFLEGMAVRSKVDVMIGNTVIVQAGALGIIQARVDKASPEEEDMWKVQFVSTLGKKPAVVPKVKSSEIQKVDISQLAAQSSSSHTTKRKTIVSTRPHNATRATSAPTLEPGPAPTPTPEPIGNQGVNLTSANETAAPTTAPLPPTTTPDTPLPASLEPLPVTAAPLTVVTEVPATAGTPSPQPMQEDSKMQAAASSNNDSSMMADPGVGAGHGEDKGDRV